MTEVLAQKLAELHPEADQTAVFDPFYQVPLDRALEQLANLPKIDLSAWKIGR